MVLKDIIIVSLLGIVIVFSGLLLTAFLVYSFQLKDRFQARFRPHGVSSRKRKVPEPEETPPADDIVAVIAAVIELEMRIGVAPGKRKLTFVSREP